MPSVALLKTCSFGARRRGSRRTSGTAGSRPPSASAAGLGDHVLLGDAALDEALREARRGTGSGPCRGTRSASSATSRSLALRRLDERRRRRRRRAAAAPAGAHAPRRLGAARAPARRPSRRSSRARELGERRVVRVRAPARPSGRRTARCLARLELVRLEERARRAPLTVSAIEQLRRVRRVGREPLERGAAARRRRCRRSAPPPSRTRAPCASRSPRSLTCSTHVSDWILLWSTIAVISPKPSFAAWPSDSQNCPSCSSPSPVMHEHAAPAAGEPRGAREPLGLGDAHAERAGVGVDRRDGVRCRDGRAGRPGGAGGAAASKSSLPVRGEHGVDGGRVVALGGEADVVARAAPRGAARRGCRAR